MGTPDPCTRDKTWIVVECCHPKHNVCLRGAVGDQLRSTGPAKPSKLPRRRFESCQIRFTFCPTEVLPHYAGRCCKGGRVCLATCPTVAMHDGHVDQINLIFDSPAQTAPFHRIPLSWPASKMTAPSIAFGLSAEVRNASVSRSGIFANSLPSLLTAFASHSKTSIQQCALG